MNENDRAKVARARVLREKLANINPENLDDQLALLLALLKLYREIEGEGSGE